MKLRKLKYSSLLLVLSVVLCASTFAQTAPGRLGDQRISLHFKQKPLFTVLWTVIQKYDVAIGFEESALDRGHRHYEFEVNRALKESTLKDNSERIVDPPVPGFEDNLITVDFENADLRTVLNSIVVQMKHYVWEVNDGVVNIYPKEGRDDRLKRLLNVRVKSFSMGIGAPADDIQPRIMLFLPELKSFLAENDLFPETAQRLTYFDEWTFPDGLVLQDITFKELLNRLTKSKRGGWAIRIKKDDKSDKELFVLDI